jgi:hypothetical protein
VGGGATGAQDKEKGVVKEMVAKQVEVAELGHGKEHVAKRGLSGLGFENRDIETGNRAADVEAVEVVGVAAWQAHNTKAITT